MERAKTIALLAIEAMADSATVPLDRPMNTSAPRSADSVELVRPDLLVWAASAALTGSARPGPDR